MKDDSFCDFILDQLRDIPGIEARRMFGAHGLYAGDTFFAIACKGELYFKTDEKSRGEYERRVTATSRDEVGELGRAFNRMPRRDLTVPGSGPDARTVARPARPPRGCR